MTQRQKRYLVVCTLRLGDVLLTTPLTHSIRQADPHALIDMLVLKGMEGMLEGNPDIDHVIAVPHRTGLIERLKEFVGLWRRYDVALTTVSSDRARWYCFIAGRQTAGLYNLHSAWASVRLLQHRVLFDDLNTHTLTMGLAVLDLVGLPRHYTVVPPTAGGLIPEQLKGIHYAVLHPYPKFNYKMWTSEGWIALAQSLQQQGLRVVLTGGQDADELHYNRNIAAASSATDLSGRLTLAQTADLLRQAKLFVGPDTSITHMAAAVGIPTLALFGPTNPVKWGPWPATYAEKKSPWSLKGSKQVGNVYLLQGEGECVPCKEEGCEKRVDSFSACLQNLTISTVLNSERARPGTF